jgi:hypothetical protein
MTRTCLIVLIAAAVLGAGAGAQEDVPLRVRLERDARVMPDAASAFFDALRKNVGQGNHAAACAMIAYPLAQESGVVKDAADCEARYDAIFTIPVRKAIGKQQFEDLFVDRTGVMIGIGEVWFAGRCAEAPCRTASDLHVTAIHSAADGLVPPRGKVLLGCTVSGQRIRVSADGQGGASLGVWYAPKFDGAPARSFPRAEPAGPPTVCGSRTWIFADGTRTYTVSELPCDAYLSPPPMGSVGRVTLSTAPDPGVPLWCIE